MTGMINAAQAYVFFLGVFLKVMTGKIKVTGEGETGI